MCYKLIITLRKLLYNNNGGRLRIPLQLPHTCCKMWLIDVVSGQQPTYNLLKTYEESMQGVYKCEEFLYLGMEMEID